MNAPQVSAARLTLVAWPLAALLSTSPAFAQGARATVQANTGGQTTTLAFVVTDEGIEIDLAPQPMAMIWKSGPPPEILMMQGGQCIRMGEQAFTMLQQMQGQTAGSPELDFSNVGLEPLGENRTVGPWTASGLRVTGIPGGNDATLWVSADVDLGLLELMARMGETFESMPLGGNAGQMAQFREIRESGALPDGGVVELVSRDSGGNDTTLTLQSVEEGSFTLSEPSNCQEMPAGIPGLPE